MRIDKKGLPIHKDATIQIRPRIFLEGNFFVDLQPGLAVRADARRRRHDPGQPDQARRCSSTRSSARCRPTRARTSSACSTSSPRGSTARAARGFNRSIPYWKHAYERRRDRRPMRRWATSSTTSRLHQERGRDRPRRWTATTPAQEPDHGLQHDRAAFAVERHRPEQAIAELPRTLHAGLPALAALNASFPPLRRFIRDFRPACAPAARRSTPACRSSEQLRCAGAAVRAAGPGARPGPDRAGADAAQQGDAAALRAGPLGRRAARTRSILPWTQDKIQDTTFPTDGTVFEESTKPLGGLAGESRSGDANGQWFRVLVSPAATTPTRAGSNFFLTERSRCIGVNPPPPAKRTRGRSSPTSRARPSSRPDLRSNPLVRRRRRRSTVTARGEGRRRRGDAPRPSTWLRNDAGARRAEAQGHRDAPQDASTEDRQVDATAIRKHVTDFAAIIGLPSSRGRRGLHAAQRALALPDHRGGAVQAQGRVLHGAGRHAGPGPDRARLRRAHRRHREGRPQGRPSRS